MNDTLFLQLSRLFRSQGFNNHDATPIAVALLVAVQEDRTSDDVETLFQGLANRLEPRFDGDASELVAAWLTDPGLLAMDLKAVSSGLAFLRSKSAGPVDWSAELASVLAGPLNFNLSLSVSKAITRALNLPVTGSCACLFLSSVSIAWVLSADRDVTVFPADRNASIILMLLARAACRPLKVNRRNPIDGTYMPAPSMYESPSHGVPFEPVDFLISVPPFGQRIQEGHAKGMPFEVLQAQRLIPYARRSFTMLVPDGVLFRESRSETEFREQLARDNGLKVVSLPHGIWGRSTGLQTSMLTLRPNKPGIVTFVDGRTMSNASRIGRDQESLILQHLDTLEDAPHAEVSLDELEINAFSFTVGRYVLSDDAAKVEAALEERHTVKLGDVAKIIRPKAPLAARGVQEANPGQPGPRGRQTITETPIAELTRALEITPLDIIDGQVELGGREVFFDSREAGRLNAVRIEAGDVLVSIKGNIGIVGLVGDEPESYLMDDPPWIISQSLAIIRVEHSPMLTAALLNAILTAPAAQAQMRRLAGGSTVPTLSIGTLRDLEIPMPSEDEALDCMDEVESINDLRAKIDELSINLTVRQKSLWAKLWNLPYEFGAN